MSRKQERKQPPSERRALLLATGCIENHPSTLVRRGWGLIRQHEVADPGTPQPFKADPRCPVCRRARNRHATACPEPLRIARSRRAEARP